MPQRTELGVMWNPWHGCRRVSEGCRNCYVYRIDGMHGKNGGEVRLNADFLLPLREGRSGSKIEPGQTVYTCFSSDFLLEDADPWRGDAWRMMRIRQDLQFVFFTKRIERMEQVLPPDWGTGYPNVAVGCTCENQEMADRRLPVFLDLPISRRMIICSPLLSAIELRPYLRGGRISEVTVGGESGDGARVCDYDWVLGIRSACAESGVRFGFYQTGALLRRDGKLYRIPRAYQHSQAKKAGLDLL